VTLPLGLRSASGRPARRIGVVVAAATSFAARMRPVLMAASNASLLGGVSSDALGGGLVGGEGAQVAAPSLGRLCGGAQLSLSLASRGSGRPTAEVREQPRGGVGYRTSEAGNAVHGSRIRPRRRSRPSLLRQHPMRWSIRRHGWRTP
jgi:hypothetical protein